MKKLLIITVILFIIAGPIFSEESPAVDKEPGFGLQSDVFNYVLTSSNNMLNAATDIPTNFEKLQDYPMTPGDIFKLIINYGANSDRSADYTTTYTIPLKSDYTMFVPFIGEIDTKELTITELHSFISDQISEMMPVQYISFYLMQPATFNVFIYGGVNISGFINATPVTTIVDAIALCKGFKTNASYRDVRIIRGDEEISVDISNFYKYADIDSNPRLIPGDKLYIPMAQKVVTINGMVKYPGVYELIEGETLETLINLAGGLKPGAWMDKIETERVKLNGESKRLQATFSDAGKFNLEDGDVIMIPSISENAETITVEGAIYGKTISAKQPFTAPTASVKLEVPYHPGITLLQVLDQVGGPTPYAITDRAQVRRPDEGEFVSIDIENLWKTRKESYDVELKPGDHILIPVERTVVGVFGAVNATDSDNYALTHVNGYTVMDYILLAGGIDYTTADINNIQLIDRDAKRIKVELTDEVPPGSIIYVGENLLQLANDNVFSNVLIVTTFATAIISFITTVISFAGSF